MPQAPSRFDAERRAAYLALLRTGYGRHEAAREVGVDPATVVRYRSADGPFDLEVVRAEEEAAEPVARKLYEAAREGQPWAVKLWLGRRAQGRAGGASWEDGVHRVEVSGQVGVAVEVELGPAAARVAELRARLEARREALALGGTVAVDMVEGPDGVFAPALEGPGEET